MCKLALKTHFCWDWWECWYFVMRQRITNADGDMKVYTQFHGNPSNSCWDTSLKTTNAYLLVENKTEDHKSHRVHHVETRNVCGKCCVNPCSRCKDISKNCRNADLLVELRKKSGGDSDSSLFWELTAWQKINDLSLDFKDFSGLQLGSWRLVPVKTCQH